MVGDDGGVGAQRWRIDAGLARDLSAAVGWRPADGVAALMGRLPERVPCGSTAKLDAMAAGAVPPGADAGGLARRVVEHRAALADRPAGGAPTPSWSCWVTATLAATLLVDAEVGPVRVAAVRRVDERSPVVDLHAAVLVDDGAESWLGDPYFGLAVRVPDRPGGVAADETATGSIR
ncbi:MAG: hypothetical protein JWM05_1592, partial [Acidimicrobiales bacterium]|nr:hypothetical protein [Acidimicrobiales bacterium]